MRHPDRRQGFIRAASRLVLLLAFAACGREVVDPRHADVPIERFGEVDAGLFRGAQPTPEGLAALPRLGVRTVVNLREKDEDSAWMPAGVDLVKLPAHITKPRDDEIRAFFELALDPVRRPLFVHCAEGRERTGFYAALYRIEVCGWTPAKALDEMRAFGFVAADHPEVVAFVEAYRPRGFAGAASATGVAGTR